MSEVGDTLSIKCAKSTRAIDLNTFNSYAIPGAGTSIIKSSGYFVVDEGIGVRYYGASFSINKSRQMVITNEPGIREFNSREYGPNHAVNRILNDLEKMQIGYACCYDHINGFTFWGLDE